MSKEDRKGLGDLAPTAAEVSAKAAHKCEKEMQDQIRQWLDLQGWFYVCQRMDRPTTGRRGQPDFVICVPQPRGTSVTGIFVAVECKMPDCHLTLEQTSVMNAILRDGGEYMIATSAREALEFLKGLAE